MELAKTANTDVLRHLSVVEDSLPILDIESLIPYFLGDLDVSESTKQTYTRVLHIFNRYLQEQDISSPTLADIIEYKEKLMMEGKKSHTVQNYLIAIKQFFKWTSDPDNRIYPNVARKIKNVKIKNKGHYKDYLKKDKVLEVVKQFNRDTVKGKRDYAMFVLMVTTGARSIEVSRMDIQDITTKAGQLVILIQGKGETEKERPIKVSKTAYEAINDYLNAKAPYLPNEPLFTSLSNNSAGKRLSTRTIRGAMKNAFRQAGIDNERITCHSLRHTFATQNLLNGGSFEETKEAMGHSSIVVTQRYAHNYQWELNYSESRVDDALFN